MAALFRDPRRSHGIRRHLRHLTAACVIACALLPSVTTPASAQIDVYFTRPVDTSLASSPANRARYDPDVSQLVARMISSARSSIDMAMYNLNVQRVADALIAAHRRGVRVRVVAHVENVSNPASRFAQLAAVGIPLITNPRADAGMQQQLMHNKFLIIDGRAGSADTPTVVTGSWNATVAQTLEDANNVVVIRDIALAEAYLAEFEEMWGSTTDVPDATAARFGAAKRDNTPDTFVLSDGTRVDLFFSPSDAVESRIRDAVSTAQRSIYTANLTITSGVLANQVILQNGRGADARVLVENIDDQGSQFGALSGRIDARSTAAVPGQLHHKYAIADAIPIGGGSVPLVVTGSHNWTYSANSTNDENTLIIYSAAVANQFLQEFAARYREAGGTRPFGGASSVESTERESSGRGSSGRGSAANLSAAPNPFTNVVTLSRALPCRAEITLVDALGRTLLRRALAPGDRTIALAPDVAGEGVLLLRVAGCDGDVWTIPVARMR